MWIIDLSLKSSFLWTLSSSIPWFYCTHYVSNIVFWFSNRFVFTFSSLMLFISNNSDVWSYFCFTIEIEIHERLRYLHFISFYIFITHRGQCTSWVAGGLKRKKMKYVVSFVSFSRICFFINHICDLFGEIFLRWL